MDNRCLHLLIVFHTVSTFCYFGVAQEAGCGQARCVDLSKPDTCGRRCNDPCTSLTECAISVIDNECDGLFESCVNAPTHIVALSLVGAGVDSIDPCPCNPTDFLECFSSAATAEVEHTGKTLVKDIRVGDKVLTGSNNYKPVYTIDHKNPHKQTSFVQIYSKGNDSPLEITNSHMVFVHGKKHPIRASAVKVGASLRTVNGSSIVTDISYITREGLWNPITSDGTIVVDGIITSTYNVPFTNINDGAHVEVAGFSLMSHHDFLHLLSSPYRAICLGMSLSFCETKQEYNMYSSLGVSILKFHHQQEKLIQDMMLFIFLVVFKLLNFVVNPVFLIGAIPGVYFILASKKKISKADFQP